MAETKVSVTKTALKTFSSSCRPKLRPEEDLEELVKDPVQTTSHPWYRTISQDQQQELVIFNVVLAGLTSRLIKGNFLSMEHVLKSCKMLTKMAAKVSK